MNRIVLTRPCTTWPKPACVYLSNPYSHCVCLSIQPTHIARVCLSNLYSYYEGEGGAAAAAAAGAQGEQDILTKDFLRKYIFYAKSRVQPKVSEWNECVHVRACVCVLLHLSGECVWPADSGTWGFDSRAT